MQQPDKGGEGIEIHKKSTDSPSNAMSKSEPDLSQEPKSRTQFWSQLVEPPSANTSEKLQCEAEPGQAEPFSTEDMDVPNRILTAGTHAHPHIMYFKK